MIPSVKRLSTREEELYKAQINQLQAEVPSFGFWPDCCPLAQAQQLDAFCCSHGCAMHVCCVNGVHRQSTCQRLAAAHADWRCCTGDEAAAGHTAGTTLCRQHA